MAVGEACRVLRTGTKRGLTEKVEQKTLVKKSGGLGGAFSTVRQRYCTHVLRGALKRRVGGNREGKGGGIGGPAAHTLPKRLG